MARSGRRERQGCGTGAGLADLLRRGLSAARFLTHLLAGQLLGYGFSFAPASASGSIPDISFNSKPKFGTVLLNRL